jgi:predicted ATPase
LKAGLLLRRDQINHGLRLLRTALGELLETGSILRYSAFLGVLAEGLAAAGQVAEGRAAVDEALARAEAKDERWCIAELLRVKAELILLENVPGGAVVAEKHLRRALDWAKQQGALSWELRAVTTLARMWRDRGRSKEAHEVLAGVYNRFTEGFETADLKTARKLLAALQ